MATYKAASLVGIAAGTATLLTGAASDATGTAIVGTAVLIVSAMATSVHLVLDRLTDTSAERRALRDEHAAYVAAQVSIQRDREEVRRALADGTIQTQKLLASERATMRAQFEQERFEIQSAAYSMAIEHMQNGLLSDHVARDANVLPFPTRPAVPAPQQTSLN